MHVSRSAAKVAGLTFVAAAMGAGVAAASIPGSDGKITACYLKSGGSLRVIDAGVTNCKSTESKLAWNIQGVPGTNGTNGTNGADGTDGQDGVSGYEVVSKTVEQEEGFGGGVTKTMLFDVSCPTGKVAVGGGGAANLDNATSTLGPADVSQSAPDTSDSTQWNIGISKLDGSYFADGEGVYGTIYAVCVTAN